MLLVLFLYAATHNDGELNVTWFQVGWVSPDKCFIVKTSQSLVRYSRFMFVPSWRNFNSPHRVLPTPLMLICEFAATVCAILYCDVCFWTIKYLTNVMCNSHRKPRYTSRWWCRCFCFFFVFFFQLFFFFKFSLTGCYVRCVIKGCIYVLVNPSFRDSFSSPLIVILLYWYGLFFTKNANTGIKFVLFTTLKITFENLIKHGDSIYRNFTILAECKFAVRA